MIKSVCFGLVAALMFCGTASAEFVIDDFSILGSGDDTAVTLLDVGGMELTRTITKSGVSAVTPQSDYFGLLGSEGLLLDPAASFRVKYDWADFGTTAAMTGMTTNLINIADIPFSEGSGTWSTSYVGGSFVGVDQIDISGTTSVEFVYTIESGELGGFADARYGGANLTAVPEPTSLLMFGSLMTLGLIRRRSNK